MPWVSISMYYACDPVPIVVGLRLAALWVAGAPLINMVQKKVHRTIVTEFNNKKIQLHVVHDSTYQTQ